MVSFFSAACVELSVELASMAVGLDRPVAQTLSAPGNEDHVEISSSGHHIYLEFPAFDHVSTVHEAAQCLSISHTKQADYSGP